MPKIIPLNEIKTILKTIPTTQLLDAIEGGFKTYFLGEVVVPPVGTMQFDQPPGEVHIKYGYQRNSPYYVIKIASGFYDNPKMGLSSSNGNMLVYSQKTGELKAILLDNGYLTDIRTALAGALAAKYLAPKKITGIGIVGTGIQARLQLQYLLEVLPVTLNMPIWVWGRSDDKLQAYQKGMQAIGIPLIINPTKQMDQLVQHCNLLVTCTPAKSPLIKAVHFANATNKGFHITAMGSDTKGKQEIDASILAKADLLIADSYAQCAEYGEISHALNQNLIQAQQVTDLGKMLLQKQYRESDEQITIADLTGVAVQDIVIAELVLKGYSDIAN